MNKIPVNPWTWQDQRGFTQARYRYAPTTIANPIPSMATKEKVPQVIVIRVPKP